MNVSSWPWTTWTPFTRFFPKAAMDDITSTEVACRKSHLLRMKIGYRRKLWNKQESGLWVVTILSIFIQQKKWCTKPRWSFVPQDIYLIKPPNYNIYKIYIIIKEKHMHKVKQRNIQLCDQCTLQAKNKKIMGIHFYTWTQSYWVPPAQPPLARPMKARI